jgi:pimeloyl-ACP methyl ester carboxylesterase
MKLAQKLALRYLRTRLNFIGVFSKRKAAEEAFEIFCTPLRKSKKEEGAIFGSVERHYGQVDGKRIAMYRWNPGGTKKVMILHGFESATRNFERYIELLIKKGYTVIAADAPAHGDSEGRQINLPLYVRTIGMVVEKFGPMDSYMAHSFGGLAIIHFLEHIAHTPDQKIALIAPATETNTAVDMLFNMLQLDKDVKEEFEQVVMEKGGHPSKYYSIPRALDNIRATILWVHDEDDDITPISDIKPLMKKQLPNIEFLITKNLGHRKIYRDNKVVKRVIDFL